MDYILNRISEFKHLKNWVNITIRR